MIKTGMIEKATRTFQTSVVTTACLIMSAFVTAVVIFGMKIGSAIALYFVVWWIILFITLPFGVKSQLEAGIIPDGSDPGAPAVPMLRAKVVWTSILSFFVFLLAAGFLPYVGY